MHFTGFRQVNDSEVAVLIKGYEIVLLKSYN